MTIWRVHLRTGKQLRIEADEIGYEVEVGEFDEVEFDPETIAKTYVEFWFDDGIAAVIPRSEIAFCMNEDHEMPALGDRDSAGYRLGG